MKFPPQDKLKTQNQTHMNHHHQLTLPALAALLSLLAPSPARGVVDEAPAQYQQRYGKPTHEMNVDARHPGLIYKRGMIAIFSVFEKERSVGEMIFKLNGMSAVDIADLLRQNGAGLAWKKENLTMGKGDQEKMKSQGVLDLQMWSRADGKAFATYMKMGTGTGKDRQEMNTLLVGTKKGVKLVTEMAAMNKQWVPKPVK
jgi:hypothetical protein